jgi:hypothetical protein
MNDFLGKTTITLGQWILITIIGTVAGGIILALLGILGGKAKDMIIRFFKWLPGKIFKLFRSGAKASKEKKQRIARFKSKKLTDFDVDYLINKADSKKKLTKLEASLLQYARELKEQQPKLVFDEKVNEAIKNWRPDYSKMLGPTIHISDFPKFEPRKK